MRNKRLTKGYTYIMIFIILLISILLFGNHINEFVGTIGLVASVMIVVYQLSCENDITMGSFILELNNSFTGNARIQAVYNKLKVFEDLDENKQQGWITEDDRANLDEYLVFFETISVLRKKGVIEMDILDDMFGYRFFIAMNNPLVQKIELQATGFEHYEALVELYEDWRKYRLKRGGSDSMPGEIRSSFSALLVEGDSHQIINETD